MPEYRAKIEWTTPNAGSWTDLEEDHIDRDNLERIFASVNPPYEVSFKRGSEGQSFYRKKTPQLEYRNFNTSSQTWIHTEWLPVTDISNIGRSDRDWYGKLVALLETADIVAIPGTLPGERPNGDYITTYYRLK